MIRCTYREQGGHTADKHSTLHIIVIHTQTSHLHIYAGQLSFPLALPFSVSLSLNFFPLLSLETLHISFSRWMHCWCPLYSAYYRPPYTQVIPASIYSTALFLSFPLTLSLSISLSLSLSLSSFLSLSLIHELIHIHIH